MRIAFVVNLPEWIDYRNMTHAHSHLAMMGWIYLGLYIFILKTFDFTGKKYRILFGLSVISTFGMLISYPIQGYGAISITFTTIHLLLSYVFAFLIVKDSYRNHSSNKSYSLIFLRTALGFLVLSSLGTWMLGVFMATGMRGSAFYYGSVQFYLHFQFNGWFIFACIAILLRIIEQKKISIDKKLIQTFYYLLIISCLLTFALAISWSTPDKLLFWTNSLGVIIQTMAIIYFIKILIPVKDQFKNEIQKWTLYLWSISLVCFISKIIIQTMVAIPYLATISYTIKNFVIGFIHLLMLGSISTFLIGMSHFSFSYVSNLSKQGTKLFLLGFIVTEFLLFLQGIMLWMKVGFLPFYYSMIFIFSALMALGILIHFISTISRPTKSISG